jgi:hypothetical protein
MKTIRSLFALLMTLVMPNIASAQFSAQQTYCAGSCVAGTGNAIILNIPNITTAADLVGVPLRFRVANANTGPATVTVGSAPTANLLKIGPSGMVPLVGGELPIGPPAPTETIIFDGTEFVLQTGAASLVSLTSTTNYYVSNSGNDANNCTSPATACATVQHVDNLIVSSFSMNGATININVADGSYPPFICLPLNGSGTINIIGDNTTPAGLVIAAASGEAVVVKGSGYVLSGMTLSSASNGSAPHLGIGLRVDGAITVTIYNMSFGTATFAQIEAGFGATVQMLGVASGSPTDYINIVGSAPVFMYVDSGGSISTGQTNLNLIGTPSYSISFALATTVGTISLPFNSIVGNASGLKYTLSLNGVISTSGNCAGYPGTGTSVSTGGQCL